MTYRAGGPRLRLEAAQLPRADSRLPSGSGVRLTVINAGRAAVTVQNFAVTPYGERKPAITVQDVHGPALPHRLEPHASETWEADALPAAREYDSLIRSGRLKPNSTWPSQFRFTVVAGNGKRASDRRAFDSLRLIADSQDG